MNFIDNNLNNILEIIDKDDVRELESYIQKKHINLKNLNNNFDILIYAIESNISIEVIECIIHQCQYETFNYYYYVSLEYRNKYHPINFKGYKTPLFSAVALSKFKIANLLIDGKADINFAIDYQYDDMDNEKINILHYLSRFDYLNKENLMYILSKGFCVDGITSDDIDNWISSKYKNNLLGIVFQHFIFDNTFIINLLHIYKNKTPLSREQFKVIISKEKNKLQITDSMYDNAMKRWYEKMKVIELLFDYDSRDLNLVLNKIYKNKILQKAVCLNNYTLVQKILNIHEFNYEKIDMEQIIIEAMNYNHCDITKYLIEKFMDAKFRELHHYYNFCENLLLKASKFNNIAIMKFIIQKLLGLTFNDEDIANQMDTSKIIKSDIQYLSLLLNILIKIQNLSIIQYLMNSTDIFFDVNVKDKNEEYPIFIAYYGIGTKITPDHLVSQEIFKYLVEHGAHGYTKNKYSQSLLSLAIQDKNYLVIKWLLVYNQMINEEINVSDMNHSLISAIYRKRVDLLQTLLNENEKIYEDDFNYSGFTPLIISYFLNSQEIFKILLNYVNINEVDQFGNTVFYYSLIKEDIETLKYLIEIGVEINIQNKFKYTISPLHISIDIGNKEIFLLLLDSKNLLVNEPNEHGEIPLMTLLINKKFSDKDKIQMIKCLIHRGANVNYVNEKNGKSCLSYAIKMKSIDLIRLLIQKGALVNYVVGNTIQSSLIYALHLGDLDTLKCLIENIPENNILNGFIEELVENYEKNLNEEIFEYLVKYNINNITIRIIQTVINENNFHLLKMLIGPEFNVNINMKDKEGNISLVYAIKTRNKPILEYLIENGADIYNINHKGDTIGDINKIYNYNYYQNIYQKISEILNRYKKN